MPDYESVLRPSKVCNVLKVLSRLCLAMDMVQCAAFTVFCKDNNNKLSFCSRNDTAQPASAVKSGAVEKSFGLALFLLLN